MKPTFFIIFITTTFFLFHFHTSFSIHHESYTRRFLHQPFFPETSVPPPSPPTETDTPPPSPDANIPFFYENPPPPPQSLSLTSNASFSNSNPTATLPNNGTKKVAIAISVGIVTLGMLTALAFFLYKHKAIHHVETQKLMTQNSNLEDSMVPPSSSILYIGTVEPTVTEPNSSPYQKLSSVNRSERYRPSPELHPLPPLRKNPPNGNYPPAASPSFHSPRNSSVSYEDSYYTPISRQSSLANVSPAASTTVPPPPSFPLPKRISPKSRVSASSPDIRHIIIPSIKQTPPPPSPAPLDKRANSGTPPAPNSTHLQSPINKASQVTRISLNRTPPPPPPPPPPRFKESAGVRVSWSNESRNEKSCTPSEGGGSSSSSVKKGSATENVDNRKSVNNGVGFCESVQGNEKPKLKALHWDKVRATSDRDTVWDHLKSNSFQLNEVMMESLFGCNATNSVPKEPIKKSFFPSIDKENRVLDPKKSQNIAILIRALNVTRDEVSKALLDGNPEGLGAELLETLVKMAPTKEEEIKLKNYDGDLSKLGSAERFLKAMLDIPFAFKRVEAMLYRANFDAEVNHLRKSFQILEAASVELRNSPLFFKLLEAVLRTGNRMNVGTNRGDAKAFKLETLLKLVDIKGTDGKTTLLHFVVQKIIRSEDADSESANDNVKSQMDSKFNEDEFKKQGLHVVAGLSRDLCNVKKAAGMDSDVLSSYLSKLETGLDKVRLVLQYEKPDVQGNFFKFTKLFLRDAEDEIGRIKADEKKALFLVKEVTEYFHGDTAKEEAHPLRIFMIVRDFLNILDLVCKEVGRMHDRIVGGSSRSFRIAATASLPVLDRYNARQDRSSDEESSSP